MEAHGRGELGQAVLAGYDRITKTGYLHQTICKGLEDRYVIQRIIDDIDEAGYIGERIVLRSDQEHTIVAVGEAVAEGRRGATTPMRLQQADSQANGEVEGWIGRAKCQVRTLKDCLESHVREHIGIRHPVWEWMLEWSAGLMNRYRVGGDGKTGLQRIRGKRSHKQVCIFGEKVLWMPLDTKNYKRAKSESKILDGVWLGLRAKSDEDLIGTPHGVVRARTVRRLPEDQRRDGDYLRSIRGTPREPIPGRTSTRIPVRAEPRGDKDSDDDDSDDDDDGSGPKEKRRKANRQKAEAPGVYESGESLLPPPAPPGPVPEPNIPAPPPEPRGRKVYEDEVGIYGTTKGCSRCYSGTGAHTMTRVGGECGSC